MNTEPSDPFDRICSLVGRLVDLALVAGGGALAAIVAYNVFSRYVFRMDLAWSSELAIFLMVWTTFFGCVSAVRRGAHLQVEELVGLIPEAPRKVVRVLIDLVVIGVLTLIIWYGTNVALMNMSQLTTALYWPVGLLYAAAPAGCALMLLFTVQNMRNRLLGRKD